MYTTSTISNHQRSTKLHYRKPTEPFFFFPQTSLGCKSKAAWTTCLPIPQKAMPVSIFSRTARGDPIQERSVSATERTNLSKANFVLYITESCNANADPLTKLQHSVITQNFNCILLLTYQCKDKNQDMYQGISNVTKCNADTMVKKYSQHFNTKLTTEGHSPTY